ncbi:hypothetical protein ACJJTC_014327, partial [Scirpophaga incertulas]
FGLNKFFVPLLIGGQVLLKSILFAMFLPSILGSFGKILGKGISQLSASSSQASYPPQNEDQGYNSENKDFMGYETNPTGTYAYPNDGFYTNMESNDGGELSNVDMSRFGTGGQRVSYLPTKNGYYKNQMAATNNYKLKRAAHSDPTAGTIRRLEIPRPGIQWPWSACEWSPPVFNRSPLPY